MFCNLWTNEMEISTHDVLQQLTVIWYTYVDLIYHTISMIFYFLKSVISSITHGYRIVFLVVCLRNLEKA